MVAYEGTNFTDFGVDFLLQELPVFALFFASCLVWRRVLSFRKQRAKKAANKHARPVLSQANVDGQTKRQPEAGVGPQAWRQPKERSSPQTDVGSWRAPRADAAHVRAGLPEPSVVAAEREMLGLLSGREFTRALNVFRSLERVGHDRHLRNEELYTAFVNSAIRVGKIDVVERMVRAMFRNGVGPSLAFWQATLKMLSSRRHPQACLALHRAFSRDIPRDKVVYSCVINAALDCDQANLAAELLPTYAADPTLDSRDQVLVFRTYAAVGDVESAERALRQKGEQATTLMANLLLLTCVNAGAPEKAAELLQELQELEARGARSRVLDAVSYNTVIGGLARAGAAGRCFECLREMRRHGLEPNDVTFTSLLGVTSAGVADETGEVVAAARATGPAACGTVAKGHLCAGNLRGALEVYAMMREQLEARPDVVLSTALIRALVDAGDPEAAVQVLSDLARSGQKLSGEGSFFQQLFEACRHANKWELGKRVLDVMVEAGATPSELALTTLLKLYGSCGVHEAAHELVGSWEEAHGVAPSVIHYTCLISGCLRTRDYEQAWRAFDLMSTRGVAPDETLVARLAPGLVAAKMWDRLVELAAHALRGRPPLSIPGETLNSALWQMPTQCAAGRARAARLAEIMSSAGVELTVRNAKKVSAEDQARRADGNQEAPTKSEPGASEKAPSMVDATSAVGGSLTAKPVVVPPWLRNHQKSSQPRSGLALP